MVGQLHVRAVDRISSRRNQSQGCRSQRPEFKTSSKSFDESPPKNPDIKTPLVVKNE